MSSKGSKDVAVWVLERAVSWIERAEQSMANKRFLEELLKSIKAQTSSPLSGCFGSGLRLFKFMKLFQFIFILSLYM